MDILVDGKNVLTFEKRPPVAMLKLERSQIEYFFHVFNFSSATRGRFSNSDTFLASMAIRL